MKNKYKMPGGFHVEIERDSYGITTLVSGVISIIELDKFRLVLKVRKGKIGITGNSLRVSVFENGSVKVSGEIKGVELL